MKYSVNGRPIRESSATRRPERAKRIPNNKVGRVANERCSLRASTTSGCERSRWRQRHTTGDHSAADARGRAAAPAAMAATLDRDTPIPGLLW